MFEEQIERDAQLLESKIGPDWWKFIDVNRIGSGNNVPLIERLFPGILPEQYSILAEEWKSYILRKGEHSV